MVMEFQREYKTSEKERAYAKAHYQKNIEKYRAYKKAQMAKRRANPKINEKIKAQQRKWYHNCGGLNKQRRYHEKEKKERFFKWRVRLFNMHHKTKHTEQDFKILWEKQNGVCFFTGWILTNTAQIDHITPITRGGNHELSNLRWICREANYAKRNLTDAEFINVIRAIAEALTPPSPTVTGKNRAENALVEEKSEGI